MRIFCYADNGGLISYAAEREGGRPERLEGDILHGLQPTGESADIGRVLAPLVPKAIYGIGMNYRSHAEETGMALPERPLVFSKAVTSVQDPEGPIVLPRKAGSTKVDGEAELAVVLGRRAKNVKVEEALGYVLGYTCANDVSARDWQFEWGSGQFARAKGFDTFCPLGPVLVTADEVPDPARLVVRGLVNGEKTQEAPVSDLVFNVAELIAFLSESTTLEPGTVILTGTPGGVGHAAKPPRYLQPGDTFTVEIEGLGKLENPVVEELL